MVNIVWNITEFEWGNRELIDLSEKWVICLDIASEIVNERSVSPDALSIIEVILEQTDNKKNIKKKIDNLQDDEEKENIKNFFIQSEELNPNELTTIHNTLFKELDFAGSTKTRTSNAIFEELTE